MKSPAPRYKGYSNSPKTYKELLKEEAKKHPKLYGSYLVKGRIEIIPKGFDSPAPASEKNYFNKVAFNLRKA